MSEIKDEIEFDKVNIPSLCTHKWLAQPMSQVDNVIFGRDGIMSAMQRRGLVSGINAFLYVLTQLPAQD